MKKQILTLIALISTFQVFSQDFYHSAGVGLSSIMYSQSYTGPGVNSSVSGGTGNIGGVYNPSLSFDINRKMAFNIASYPMLGFTFNSRSGGSLGVELPVVGELFFGDMDDAGGFVGAGFAYGFGADDFFSGKILGPQVSGGAQFELQQKLIKLRAAFTIGVNKDEVAGLVYSENKRNMLSLALLYPFGQ